MQWNDLCHKLTYPAKYLSGKRSSSSEYRVNLTHATNTQGNMQEGERETLLPPAMKLGQGYVFTRVCNSVHRGVCPIACWNTPPGTQAGTPPPQGADPQEQTPREQTPLGADTPLGPGISPAQCMLGDMGNKRVVCILLGCNLVELYFLPSKTKLWKGYVFTSMCPEFCPRGVYTSAHTPTLGRHPPRQTHPPGQTPSPSDGHWSGRYASYWNAFLFNILLQW